MRCSIRSHQRPLSISSSLSTALLPEHRSSRAPRRHTALQQCRKNGLRPPRHRATGVQVQALLAVEIITTGIALAVGSGSGWLAGSALGFVGGGTANMLSDSLDGRGMLPSGALRNVAWDALGFSLGSRVGTAIGFFYALSMRTGFPVASLKQASMPHEVQVQVQVSQAGDVHLSAALLEALKVHPGDAIIIQSREGTAILKAKPAATDADKTTDGIVSNVSNYQ